MVRLRWGDGRIDLGAAGQSHYLELGIELLREVDDPRPHTSFPTSHQVFMHRYSLRDLEQLDKPIQG